MSGPLGYDDIRAGTVRQVAQLMAAAAITAPKSGGHQLSDLADGGRAQFLVPNRAAHAGAGTWRWHQA